MAPPGGKDLKLTIYGLDAQGDEVDAVVFADKLKRVVSALRKLDSFYNAKGQHRFMINDLAFASASVWLREKQMRAKAVRQSPSKRFAEIGAMVSSGEGFQVNNAADEYALSTFESISRGAGDKFSYGVIESPSITPVRLDSLLERRVSDILMRAAEAAESAPRRYFQGTVIGTYDGVVKAVDLRGLFPEAKLVLSAGKKEISCIVPRKDVEKLRTALDNRALVTGRAQHDGRSMLPERIDVNSIKVVDQGAANVITLKGSMTNLDVDDIQDFGYGP